MFRRIFSSAFLWFVVAVAAVYFYVHMNQNVLEQKVQSMISDSKQQTDIQKKLASSVMQYIGGSKTTPSAKKWVEVQKKVSDTVVKIFSSAFEFNWLEPYRAPEQGGATGSGFFISDDGEFLTNFHVIGQATDIQVQIPSLGRAKFAAKVVGVSPERDVALLKLTDEARDAVKKLLGKIPYLTLGDSDLIGRGEEILALGYPLGQEHLKSTQGIVSGVERTSLVEQLCIQISAALNPGSSGGCSLNENGEVIGINFAIVVGAQNIGYVLPINDLKSAIKDMHNVKLLRKAKLGSIVEPCTEDMAKFLGNPADGGYYVAGAIKNSLLEKVKIKKGDVLYELNGHKIDFHGDVVVPWSEDKVSMIDLLNRYEVGDTINMVVYRKGERKNFSFKLEPRSVLPIRLVYPGYEEIDYEVLGGTVFMHLTANHIMIMGKEIPSILKYATLDNQYESVVVVTHVMATSPAHRLEGAITPGMIVEEVNGEKVKDLDGLRKALRKSFDTKFVTILADDKRYSVFSVDSILKDEKRLSSICQFQLSPFVKELYEKQQGAAAA